MKHSATPWTGNNTSGELVDATGQVIARGTLPLGLPNRQNMEYIAQCVNAHDALVATLENLAVAAKSFRVFGDNLGLVLLGQVKAALKLAEREETA